MGDPAGIGPEIIVKACKRLEGRLRAGELRLLGNFYPAGSPAARYPA